MNVSTRTRSILMVDGLICFLSCGEENDIFKYYIMNLWKFFFKPKCWYIHSFAQACLLLHVGMVSQVGNVANGPLVLVSIN